jgi:prepilin-type N-terminal cleavage/methylation domain-containing protein
MRKNRQRGFTLIELMLASTLGLILLIAALGILFDSANIGDVLRARVSLNAAARESFDLLLDGGKSGTNEIFGLRGLAAPPSASALWVADGNRVKLTTGTAIPLEGPRTNASTITCSAAADPIPACAGPVLLTVEGYLGGEPVVNGGARSIKDGGMADRTQELELTLFSPFLLGRKDTTTRQAIEVYRTIFTLNVD